MIATEPLPIDSGTDFFIPRFEVTIGNRRQTGEVVHDVMQVSYKDNTEEIDSFELTVNNWDAETRQLKYSDQSLFDPGQEVVLSMGYRGGGGGGLRTMIRGKITGLKPSFPSSGQPTLTVSGLNVLDEFRAEQISDRYENQTYSDIARTICGRMGVRLVPFENAPVETPLPLVIQDNQFDIVFLMTIAREAGYELVVAEEDSGPALVFGRPSLSARPTYQLTRGRSLIEFQPTLSFANQVDEVVVRGWDPVKGVGIDITVGQGDLEDSAKLETKIKDGSANPAQGRREVISNQPVANAQQARELAKGTLSEINSELVTASGSTIGLPDLRAGSQLQIDGLGTRFNGRYFVTSTTHSLGMSGYTTQFECKLIELSRTSNGEAR